MTHLTAADYDRSTLEGHWEQGQHTDYALAASSDAGQYATYIPRARWLPLPFLAPIAISAVSYVMGGVPFFTDLSFIVLVILCAICCIRELIVFPQRFGLGGLILFGGILVWICYDYCDHWMGVPVVNMIFPPKVFAKSAFYHDIFIFLMVWSLDWKWGRWPERALQAVPEPATPLVYFVLVIILFLIGMIPFFFFTNEPFYVAIWKSFWGGRSGTGAQFTAGRTGNVNYNWGGYIAQLADVGMMGAVLAAFYAVMVTRNVFQQIVCWAIWALWLAISFGTGTRGFVVFVGFPVLMLLFLKFNYKAAAAFRRISLRAYVAASIVGLLFLFLVQVQGQYRNEGFNRETMEQVDVRSLQGNEMFTTSLLGMSLVPDEVPFFKNRYLGEGIIRPIPETIYWFVIGPIPRALWTTKPIDEVGSWYADRFTGERNGVEGTTISSGMVGGWYWQYGPWGVIEAGLLYGWMFGIIDRALRSSGGRPMALLFILAYATFMFRAFRDLWWHNMYPIMIGGVVMYVFIKMFNSLFGGVSATGEQHAAAGAPAGGAV
jgi:hypothetical protein